MATSTTYTGYLGRVVIWSPSVSLAAANPLQDLSLAFTPNPIITLPDGRLRTGLFTPFTLLAYKYTITNRVQEEDITCARVPAQTGQFSGPAFPVLPELGRLFIASDLPRVDVQIEGFWSRSQDPFDTGVMISDGNLYRTQIFFDKNRDLPNWDGNLLVLGLEVTGSTRDMVRYTLSGVLCGSLAPDDLDGSSRYWPLA